MTYDNACWMLAKSFLEDVSAASDDATCDALAQVIQSAIEDFISDLAQASGEER